MKSIAVVGSLNIDLVTHMERFPKPGETVIGQSFRYNAGGKGANQAVACGRLGGEVSMFGAIGKDFFANTLLQSLKESNVRIDDIRICDGMFCGVAHIWVDAGAENSIAVIPGANAKVDVNYVESVIPKLTAVSWLLLQLETPLPATTYLLEQLPPYTPRIVLDPAPAQSLDRFPTQRIWLITPNEHELQWLTGLSTATDEGIEHASYRLLETTGVQAVLCKAGSRGAYFQDGSRFLHFPAYCVDAVDSTAAGDAFNSALTVALSEGRSIESAIRFANAAGSLCVTAKGAQPSIPWRKDVETFLQTERV
ncbi:MAG: ribokinase [Deltaproteobacteria bacterium]|nr:ribokinase [Deltaproteobacteria bacterium]